jgi:hypothetical protein
MAGTRCTLLWTRRQGTDPPYYRLSFAITVHESLRWPRSPATDPPNYCLSFGFSVHESLHGCMWALQPCWTNSVTLARYRDCMHSWHALHVVVDPAAGR